MRNKLAALVSMFVVVLATPLLDAQDTRAALAPSPARFAGLFVGTTYELQDGQLVGPSTIKVRIRANGTGYFFYNPVGTSFLNADPLTVNGRGRMTITGGFGLARGDVVINGNTLKGSYAGQLGGVVFAGNFSATRQ